MIDKLANFLNWLCKEVSRMMRECPNKRIVHLARHGKNSRIRNKNIKRVIKWYMDEREWV